MLMLLLVAVGGALLAAFLAYAYLPRRYGRPVALTLGVPALGLVVAAIGLAFYARAVCTETVIAADRAPDGSYATAIKAVDCGNNPTTRTYDVSVARSRGDDRVRERTILRSRGAPVPVKVTALNADHFVVTLDDGSRRDVRFGANFRPDRVWSFIDGKLVHGKRIHGAGGP